MTELEGVVGELPPMSDKAVAAIDVIGRTGASGFQLRIADAEQPTLYVAVATYDLPHPVAALGEGFDAAAGASPGTAVLRLFEQLLDGGTCTHCAKMTYVDLRADGTPPLSEFPSEIHGQTCAWTWRPGEARWARGCE